MTNWITHNSTKPPALAPAALVEVWDEEHGVQVSRVDELLWEYVTEYRQLRDEDGVPCIDSEGKECWAEYVTTDMWRKPWQFEGTPFLAEDGNTWGWDQQTAVGPANNEDRHPGNWRESLYRVFRGGE